MKSRHVAGRNLCIAQGAYYLATGLWPLLSGRTFQRITGRKHDFWLAQTVGLQLALAGGILLEAAARREPTRRVSPLGLGTAAIMLAMDLWCQTQPRTTRLYLVEAVAELGLVVAWTRQSVHHPNRPPSLRLMKDSRNAPMAATATAT